MKEAELETTEKELEVKIKIENRVPPSIFQNPGRLLKRLLHVHRDPFGLISKGWCGKI